MNEEAALKDIITNHNHAHTPFMDIAITLAAHAQE